MLTTRSTTENPQDDEDASVKNLVSSAKEAFKGKVKERIGSIAKGVTKGLKGAEKTLNGIDELAGGRKEVKDANDAMMDGKALVEDTIEDGKEIANKADQHVKDALALGEKAISAGRQLKPMVGSALNIGPKLKILEPSPLDADLGVWESMTTICTVKDFEPGYIVVALEGTKFEEISNSYRPQMYVVTMSVKETAMLKDIRNDQPVCIRNPNQKVHVLNHYGLSSVDPNISNMIYPIELAAPSTESGGSTDGGMSNTSTSSSASAPLGELSANGAANGGGGRDNGSDTDTVRQSNAVANNAASRAPPPKKNELIFNFMGFVWGTNDTNPDHAAWMGEVGHEAKQIAKDAASDAKDALIEQYKRELEEEKRKQKALRDAVAANPATEEPAPDP